MLIISASWLLVNRLEAQTLEEAMIAIEREDFKKAETVLQKLLNDSPKKPELYYYMGLNYLGQADEAMDEDNDVVSQKKYLEKAKGYFEQGVNASSKYALNYAGLGSYNLQSTKDFGEAKKNLDKALELGEDNVKILLAVAEFYNQSRVGNSINEATLLLTKVITKDPKNPDALTALGDNWLEQNVYETAVEYYKKALVINPKLAKAHYMMGIALLKDKKKNEAAAAFEEAIVQDGNLGPAYRHLAKLYYDIGMFEESKNLYKKYVTMTENDPRARMLYINALYLAKDYANAIVEIQNALGDKTLQEQNKPALYRMLGYSNYELGTKNQDSTKIIAAKEAMDMYFKIVPADKIISKDYEYYGKILSGRGLYAEAASNLEKAVGQDPKLTNLFEMIGNNYNILKQYDKAAEWYKKAVEAYPKNAANFFYYGRVLKNLNNYALADSMFRRTLEINKNIPEVYKEAAFVNTKMDTADSFGKARPYYEKFIEITSDKADKYKSEIFTAHYYLCTHY